MTVILIMIVITAVMTRGDKDRGLLLDDETLRSRVGTALLSCPRPALLSLDCHRCTLFSTLGHVELVCPRKCFHLNPEPSVRNPAFLHSGGEKAMGQGRGVRGDQLFPHRSMCAHVQLFHKCVVVAAKPIELLFSPSDNRGRGLNEGIFFFTAWSQLTLNP